MRLTETITAPMAIAPSAVVAHAATGIAERERNAITGREREHKATTTSGSC